MGGCESRFKISKDCDRIVGEWTGEEDENVKNEDRQYAIELETGVIAGSPCKRRQDIKILIEFPSTEVDKKDIPGLLMKHVSSSNRRL